MRLAFVTPRFAVEGVVGGAETLIRDLAQTAAAAGHEVQLLTTCATNPHTWSNDRAPWEEVVDCIHVRGFRVKEDRDLETFFSVQDRIMKEQVLSRGEEEAWVANSITSPDLQDALAKELPQLDAILAGPYLFGLTLQVAEAFPEKTWLIPCLHDEPYARVGVIADRFRAVQGCLFNSEPEKELAMRMYGLDASCGNVVGMAIEPFEVDAEAFAKRHGLERPYVLYSGRQEQGKNTPLLLDYLHTYTERRQGSVHLVLTGSGDLPVHESLRPYLLNLGFVSEQEKFEAMAGGTAFLHPSVNESFGIVLLESWLAGTPVVVHDKGEVLKWQCQRSGGGVWFRDYPEFETLLDRLLEDQELNHSLAMSGKRYVVNTYNRTALAERLFATLQEAVDA